MSLIVGAVCPDGIVILADRLTWHDNRQRPKWTERKIRRAPSSVWGCFGMLDVLVNDILPTVSSYNAKADREFLWSVGRQLRSINFERHSSNPALQTSLLVGLDSNQKGLFEIATNGEVCPITDYAILGNPASFCIMDKALRSIQDSQWSCRSVARTVHATMQEIERYTYDQMVGLRGQNPLAFATDAMGDFSECSEDLFALQ